MYQYVRTWVFGFKVSVSVYLLCTSMYLPGFLVLRFSGFCLSVFIMYQYVRTWVFGFKVSVSVYLLCTSMYLPGFLVLSFSGYVPECTYLGFWF